MIVSFVCPSAPAPMGGVTALYEFANGLSRRGHEVHIAHGAFWNRPGIASLDELAWFRFEPEIVHHLGEGSIPLPDADVIFGTEAAPNLGRPVLLVQGFEMFPKEMERAVFRTPCLKVCVASWLVNVGIEYGVLPDQLVHVPMGIDHDTFRVTRALGARPLQVGMLYNSHPAKGWVRGRRALEQVHARIPEMRAIVFGTETPDEELPAWMTFVSDPGIDTLVHDVYNQCRVFVQPSIYEGFGFTAVEAMACGCALVSTDNGGSADYALAGETALVGPPGGIDELAANIETLLLDEPLRLRLARAGREHVRRFDWDLGAELLEGHLEAYIADPARYQTPPAPAGAPYGRSQE
jgi:glycosyltransferase involved in cell wall biosynthesis